MARSAEYFASQHIYDAQRRDAPARKIQLQIARAKYRNSPEARAAKKLADKDRPNRQSAADRLIVGVDGEGHDTPDGRHIYTYLAAVDENGLCVSEAHNPNGLSHEECIAMLLRIPKNTLRFGFMFSYDVTKIIEELSLADRYLLMRPALRVAKVCLFCKHVFANRSECPECGSEKIRSFTRPLQYRNRKYGFFNGSLTIAEGKKSVKVWDCFRFFGCAFVEALKAWKVGTEEQVARILAMKNKRGAFDVEDPEDVKRYCREECHLLAIMMRRLITAHSDAEIPLKRFEGAGSTATALLRKHDVDKYRGDRIADMKPGLAHAVASAFFGGRFENSVIGKVPREIHGYDISSAYPYAQTFLPCLACGKWTYEKKATAEKIRNASLAVAKFHVHALTTRQRRALAWAPLPFRSAEGSISYGTSFTGWAWAPELLPALAGWPDLVSLAGPHGLFGKGEAWIYKTKCKHRPFAHVPKGYRLRTEWGKEGKGIVMKLGLNAGYGKTAQSVGEDPPFQSWVWAGMTTATTRGQILDMIGALPEKKRHAVLAIATDGIYATRELRVLEPKDTGTFDLQKPLGGWEHKPVPEGIFLAKPGLYYRLAPELSDVRARGVGRREIYAQRVRLEEAFATWDRLDMAHSVTMQSRRFYGAKSSIHARSGCVPCKTSWPGIPEQKCPKCKELGGTFEVKEQLRADGTAAYGLWDIRLVNVAFDPHPKRERTLEKGGDFVRLYVRDLGGQTSAPYDVGTTSPEGDAARVGQELALEQPDWNEE